MKAPWFTDPADRYLRVVEAMPASLAPTSGSSSPELNPGVLRDVIETASLGNENAHTALAAHIAKHSMLTESEAMPLVTTLAMRNPAPTQLAKATSQAVQGLTVSGAVDLSDPAMLGPVPRLLGSAVLAAAVLMSVIYAHTLAAHSSGWAYATFMFIAFVGSLGILVLVMGYRNVTIKGSGGQ